MDKRKKNKKRPACVNHKTQTKKKKKKNESLNAALIAQAIADFKLSTSIAIHIVNGFVCSKRCDILKVIETTAHVRIHSGFVHELIYTDSNAESDYEKADVFDLTMTTGGGFLMPELKWSSKKNLHPRIYLTCYLDAFHLLHPLCVALTGAEIARSIQGIVARYIFDSQLALFM